MSQIPMHENDSTLLSLLSREPGLSIQGLAQALESMPGLEVDYSLPSEDELSGHQRYSISVPSTSEREYSSRRFLGMDPATATALLVGLGILLDYTLRKSRGDSSNPSDGDPPIIESGGSGSQELCKHIVDGEECGHPFQAPTTIRQGGSITVIRYCTKEPDPHPTVEYFKQEL